MICEIQKQTWPGLDLANDKAHIPLTKCFALSDFGWGSLSPTRSSLSARGARRVYMIKASSLKQQATLDNGYGIV